MKQLILAACLGLVCGAVPAFECERIFRPVKNFRTAENVWAIDEIDRADWVWERKATRGMFDPDWNHDFRFRCDFEAVSGEDLVLDVTADPRFILLLDGRVVSRGPHRGLVQYWQYQTYKISGLEPGPHRIEVVVWMSGGAVAQVSLCGGLCVKASGSYDKTLTTGNGDWRVADISASTRLGGGPLARAGGFGTGWGFTLTGTGLEGNVPPDAKFEKAVVRRERIREKNLRNNYGGRKDGWILYPSVMPDQMYAVKTPGRFVAVRDGFGLDSNVWSEACAQDPRIAAFNALLKEAKPVTVPAHSEVELIWDFGDYYCFYPELEMSGGKDAKVRIGSVEAMRLPNERKERRDSFLGLAFCPGKYASCFSDLYVSDGRGKAAFTTRWWRCGRWGTVAVKTAGEPLTVTRLQLAESRYPMEQESSFVCDDPAFGPIQKICTRAMQMCMHEMFMDCPFYEQQMYGGDSRVEMLTSAVMSADDRLIKHAVNIFDLDRRDNGMTAMNTPTRGTQESGTYTLYWPLMVRDYMRWHGDESWARARMPGLRHTMHAFELFEREDGLLRELPAWSFIDWATLNTLAMSAPDGAETWAPVDLFYLLALQASAELEETFGNRDLAAHWRNKAEKTAHSILSVYWDEGRGLLADTAKKDIFSEHVQALALVADVLADDRRARVVTGLVENAAASQTKKWFARTTVFFQYYLFEAYFKTGRADQFLKHLDLWRGYVDQGCATTLETPEPARSDCHAWGAHPLFWMHAGLLGVRPSGPFFKTVEIAPQPCTLKFIRAKTPHPKGFIVSDLKFDGDRVSGAVTLPPMITGVFRWGDQSVSLKSGANEIDL